MSKEIANNRKLIELTAEIVSAFVTKNAVQIASLLELIASANSSLSKIGGPGAPETPALTPAVNPKRSVFPRRHHLSRGWFKSLKLHLGVHYGLTADEYREKWGLARDYPMVAPNYAAQRSALAMASGLGRKVTANRRRRRSGRARP
ncbi:MULTISPECIES: MucR family transcriptional regulator [unclassified Mesorhizobium]|uniref:MucR family transcriptional regulator n=1 Tax=unclassified Mesorhizobium TaxID=325217 RepID=UPI00112E5134|nr:MULTISPECIES: MucR family transcriptional regulator [unclassified Mesorhizobium]MCA0035311.1 MucR family transcriptional regulator [Mesorhizobium sp. B263B2A]TPN42826.1 transcriptional regulator [Mesorhizobium sp. B1-1-7]